MRYLLTPIGSGGDVRPFVTIGRRLMERGHEAILFAAEPFGRLAADAGLGFVSTWPAEDYEREALNPDLWDPQKGVRLVMSILTAHLDEAWEALVPATKPGRTVLVAHTLSFATRAYGEGTGIPCATMHLSPNVFRSRYEQPVAPNGMDSNVLPGFVNRAMLWMFDRLLLDPMVAPLLNRFRERRGLQPVSRVFRDAIHSPRLVLGLFPDWFGRPQRDWPPQTRLTGFPVPPTTLEAVDSELESFLAAGDAPIVFTAGTANRQASSFFRVAADAAALLGRRALLLTEWRDQVPAQLPPGVRSFAYAPLSAMLDRCAAFVHHGGIGSSAQGLHSGVPQLIMPMGFDQPDNAARLERLGVGASISPKEFDATRVAGALAGLIESADVRDACRRWKERAGDGGVDAACDELERLSQATER